MSEQTTQKVLEETTELIEKTLDELEAVDRLVKNNPYVIAGVAVMGLVTGAFLGYRFAIKQLEPKYAAIADEEIAQAKVMYARLNKEGFESPSVAVNKLIPDDEPAAQEALARYQGQEVEITVVEDGILVKSRLDKHGKAALDDVPFPHPAPKKTSNIFDKETDEPKTSGWDYETELARRSDDKPFVVSQEEFFENEDNLEVINATFYEGDEVLADESDGVITDIDGTVGETNLHRFGPNSGSGEENILYVFNKKAGMAFEIARSEGKYSVEVVGLEDDEDDPPRRRRQRLGED